MSNSRPRINPNIITDLSNSDFIRLIETYNEVLVRVHGNNNGAPYDRRCISYIAELSMMREAPLQALYYVYHMTQDSDFRYNYDAHTANFYFTVGLLCSLKELEPDTITTDELAAMAEVPSDMLRNGVRQVRRILRPFREPDDIELGMFVRKMVLEICDEAQHPNWGGHRRIRRARNALIVHVSDGSSSQSSDASASGQFG